MTRTPPSPAAARPAASAPEPPPRFGTAVVLGAGIAGLLAARVLADVSGEVVLVERDRLDSPGPAPRRGVPQGPHPHNLLASGAQALEALCPGLLDELLAAGALRGGGAFFAAGGYLEASAGPPGSIEESVYASRALLETLLRRRVLAHPRVHLVDGTAAELAAPLGGRVSAVRLQPTAGESARLLQADLVVDAAGRGSRTVPWLAAAGYAAPPVERVEAGMRYATREFRRTPATEALLKGRRFFVVSPVPGQARACGILAQEGGRWIVTLVGYFGDQPPLDAAGFADFARSLPAPEPAALIDRAEPLGEIRGFAFPANVRVRFDRMAERPRGLLVMGDALAAFSPMYGQGMSVAALQAVALRRMLHEEAREPARGHAQASSKGGARGPGLEARWFRAAVAATEVPWALAAGNDRQLAPGGPHGTWVQRLRARWVRRVIRAGHHDPVAARAFVRVARLLAHPATLLHPALVWRVWCAQGAVARAVPVGSATARGEPPPKQDAMSQG